MNVQGFKIQLSLCFYYIEVDGVTPANLGLCFAFVMGRKASLLIKKFMQNNASKYRFLIFLSQKYKFAFYLWKNSAMQMHHWSYRIFLRKIRNMQR